MILSLVLAGAVIAPMAFPDLIMGEPMDSEDTPDAHEKDQVYEYNDVADYAGDSQELEEEEELEQDWADVAVNIPDTPLQTMADHLNIDFDTILERDGDLSVFDELVLPHDDVEDGLEADDRSPPMIVSDFNKDEDMLVIEVAKGQHVTVDNITEEGGNTRFDFSDGKSVLLQSVTGVRADIVHFAEI
ncbi:MAG: hypothetical protein ACWA40_10220 [Planktomarina sp.]